MIKKRKLDSDERKKTKDTLVDQLCKEKRATETLVRIVKEHAMLSFEWCEFCDRPVDEDIDYSSAGMICQNCNESLPCKTWCKELRNVKKFSCSKHRHLKYCENCIVQCEKCELTYCFNCMSEKYELDDVPICEMCFTNNE